MHWMDPAKKLQNYNQISKVKEEKNQWEMEKSRKAFSETDKKKKQRLNQSQKDEKERNWKLKKTLSFALVL